LFENLSFRTHFPEKQGICRHARQIQRDLGENRKVLEQVQYFKGVCMRKRAVQEIVCGVVAVIVAVPAFILTFDMPERVFIFPRIASAALFIFAAALLVTNIFTAKNQTREALTIKMLKSPFVVYVIISLYVFLIPVIGFFVCSAAMMLVFMLYMNVRSIKPFLICIPVMVVFLYFVFSLQLGVPLPGGFLL
jgi:hypothetical protein